MGQEVQYIIFTGIVPQINKKQDIHSRESHTTSCLLGQKSQEYFVITVLTNTSNNIPETVTCILKIVIVHFMYFCLWLKMLQK